MHVKDISVDADTKRLLIEKAIEVLPNSYAPYSNYNVFFFNDTATTEIYTGVNVENASYGGSVCAERNAIFHAAAEGERKLIALAVTGGPGGEIEDEYCAPCGICRQVMREFVKPKEFKIYICVSKDKYSVHTLEELLPHSFGPEFLLV